MLATCASIASGASNAQCWISLTATPPEDASVKDASYSAPSVYGFGHPLYYGNVIDTLRGEAQPEIDGREGLKSLELLIAMYLSARDGVRVGLPLVF